MEPQCGIILMKPPTRHPPPAAQSFSNRSNDYWEPVLMCSVPPYWPPVQKVCVVSPPPYWHPVQKICAVSPPSRYILFLCCVPPTQFSSVPWTLWLCLGFWAKLRIWQVQAFKMKPSSTCILECGTPSWACCFTVIDVILDKVPLLAALHHPGHRGMLW